MAKDMSQIEFEAHDYVRQLTGKDSIMLTTKQTSVRLETNNLATVDALAEIGNKSRNQIINDALSFGLELIRAQFDEDENKQLNDLFIKHFQKQDNETEPTLKSKKTLKGGK